MTGTPMLLGHRGARASSSVPENTPACFDLALRHGCDGFEFDVRCTADDRAVVCHDERVLGITVCRASPKQLLHLPLLADIIRVYGQRAYLDIELKVPGLEAHVLQALRDFPPTRGFVISSFLPEVLLELRARRDGVPLGLICEKRAQLARWSSLSADCVIVQEKLLSQQLIEEIHAAGRLVMVWTVNDAHSMRRFADWKVDGIISDDTKLLVDTLRPAAKPRLRAGD